MTRISIQHLTTLLTAIILGLLSSAIADDEENIEAEKKEAMEKKQQKEQEIKAQFDYTFGDVAEHIVIVSCNGERGRSSGSGFVASMDGKPYLFTNQHVILGADKIRFKSAAGKTLKPLGVELAASRDIARLPLPPENSGLTVTGKLTKYAPIAVFGNSEGGGVATELFGEVTGVGSEKVEVSADFVSGNSGSPVLNLEKEVIGIASYVSWKTNKKKVETRRFCYRLTDEKWAPVNWKKYNDQFGKHYRETEVLIDSLMDIILTWLNKPSARIDAGSHPVPSLRTWSIDHNKMVNKIENMLDQGSCTQSELDRINRKIRKDLIDSANALSKVCTDRARQIRMMNQKQKGMTGFLHNKFDSFAERLDKAGNSIQRYGVELEDYNYFHFKD